LTRDQNILKFIQ